MEEIFYLILAFFYGIFCIFRWIYRKIHGLLWPPIPSPQPFTNIEINTIANSVCSLFSQWKASPKYNSSRNLLTIHIECSDDCVLLRQYYRTLSGSSVATSCDIATVPLPHHFTYISDDAASHQQYLDIRNQIYQSIIAEINRKHGRTGLIIINNDYIGFPAPSPVLTP